MSNYGVSKVDGDWWVASCDHGSEVWAIFRATEHLANRSLRAHRKHEHGETPTPCQSCPFAACPDCAWQNPKETDA